MAVTESTLQWLRFAETNLRDIAAKMAGESDPTVRVLAAHALRATLTRPAVTSTPRSTRPPGPGSRSATP
jgi:hypothetical protein